MDTRTGEIYTPEQFELLKKEKPFEVHNYFKQMMYEPTEVQMRRVPPKVGRNERCPCGSGKKFKLCCLVKNEPPKD